MLRSLAGGIDKPIVIDGRYPSFGKSTDPEYSTDNTYDVIKRIRDDEHLFPELVYEKLYAEQPTKRTRYLELADDCEFLLIIDCDEVVITEGIEAADWPSFKEKLATSSRFEYKLRENRQYVHNIEVRITPTELHRYGKLFYKPSEMHYTSHWRLARNSDGATIRYPGQDSIPNTVTGIVMAYLGESLRPKERMQQDLDYQWELEYREGDHTEAEFLNPKLKEEFLKHLIHETRVWESEEAQIQSKEHQIRRWLERPSSPRRKNANIQDPYQAEAESR